MNAEPLSPSSRIRSTRPLSSLAVRSRGSVDPKKFPNEEFELFSIPAYDAGQPEQLLGSQIGSSKISVEPGDVLISKIVPHIQRVWIVPKKNRKRQIASGEWIAFRGEDVVPAFLRHMLLTKNFHEQFMQTVAGMGGSLLRARPSEVARIEIPIPVSVSEQRRISSILDKADDIRRKRGQVLTLAEVLLKSTFFEMFGTIDAPTRPLSDVVAKGTIVTYGIVQAGPEYPGGVPYIRTGDIKNGQIALAGLRHTSPAIASKFRRSTVRSGEIVMSIRATVGTTAVVPEELDGANLTQGTARISPGDEVTPEYLLNFLRSTRCQNWIQEQVKGATFSEITLTRLRELEIPLPPIEAQRQFSKICAVIRQLCEKASVELDDAEQLFASLSQSAFSGELWETACD
jgi:type I restriction enzyme S subunit